MQPSHFGGHGLGRPNGLAPVDRDVDVSPASDGDYDPSEARARAASDQAPLIDWGMMDAVLLLGAGRRLAFRGVALTNLRCGRPAAGAPLAWFGVGGLERRWLRSAAHACWVSVPAGLARPNQSRARKPPVQTPTPATSAEAGTPAAPRSYGPSSGGADFLQGEGPSSLLLFENITWPRQARSRAHALGC
jgi:hypothetical protein